MVKYLTGLSKSRNIVIASSQENLISEFQSRSTDVSTGHGFKSPPTGGSTGLGRERPTLGVSSGSSVQGVQEEEYREEEEEEGNENTPLIESGDNIFFPCSYQIDMIFILPI